MKVKRQLLMIFVLMGVISLLSYFALSYAAGAYRVSFIGESLTMTPAEAKDGTSVTFTFSVKNDGARLSNVQIRIVEPADSRGQGTVLKDLTGQVINAGVNTYRVTGTFRNPVDPSTGKIKGVVVELLDRSTSVLPAPVITGSGYRQFEPASFKLGKYVPLI